MHPRWKTNLQTRERENKTIILNFWRKIEKQMLPRDSVDTSRMPMEKKKIMKPVSVSHRHQHLELSTALLLCFKVVSSIARTK